MNFKVLSTSASSEIVSDIYRLEAWKIARLLLFAIDWKLYDGFWIHEHFAVDRKKVLIHRSLGFYAAVRSFLGAVDLQSSKFNPFSVLELDILLINCNPNRDSYQLRCVFPYCHVAQVWLPMGVVNDCYWAFALRLFHIREKLHHSRHGLKTWDSAGNTLEEKVGGIFCRDLELLGIVVAVVAHGYYQFTLRKSFLADNTAEFFLGWTITFAIGLILWALGFWICSSGFLGLLLFLALA